MPTDPPRDPDQPSQDPADSLSPTVAAGPSRSQGADSADPPYVHVPMGAGQRIGDFEIVREIGRGGMGIVFEARQISLNRPVALKLLPPGLGMTAESVRRFERVRDVPAAQGVSAFRPGPRRG